LGEYGERRYLIHALVGLARIAAHEQKPIRAAQLLSISKKLYIALGTSMVPFAHVVMEELAALIQLQLQPEEYETAQTMGALMSYAQIIAYATSDA
jgi:hypothetical protein